MEHSMQQTRVAIITGAAGGIGTALARHLKNNQTQVFIVDSNADALHELAKLLECDEAFILTCDGTDDHQVQAAVDRIIAITGRIDILFNNLGGAGQQNVLDIEDIDPSLWDSVIQLNLRSAYLWSRAVIPHMRKRSYGRIVNMSSTMAHGRHGPVPPGGARLAYVTAKAAILGFTSQLAKDVGRDGITVNAVSPWITVGEKGTRVREMFENLPIAQKAAVLDRAPLGRPAEVGDVARAMAFLASDDASYISGVELPVDGGFL